MRFEVVNDMHRGRNRRENEQRRTKKSIEELHLRSQTCVSNKIIKKKHHPVLSTGEIRTNNNTFTTNGQVHVTNGAIKVREHVRHSISGRNFHAHPSRQRFRIVARRGQKIEGREMDTNVRNFTRRGRGFLPGGRRTSLLRVLFASTFLAAIAGASRRRQRRGDSSVCDRERPREHWNQPMPPPPPATQPPSTMPHPLLHHHRHHHHYLHHHLHHRRRRPNHHRFYHYYYYYHYYRRTIALVTIALLRHHHLLPGTPSLQPPSADPLSLPFNHYPLPPEKHHRFSCVGGITPRLSLGYRCTR